MGEASKIAWTDHTFNPWWGCTKVSPGCANCYAASIAGRFGLGWGQGAERKFFEDAHWQEPLKWNRKAQRAGVPAFVFCASMADVFEDVPGHVAKQTNEARQRLFGLIQSTPWLVWLLLTKRPENVSSIVPSAWMSGAWPINAWVGATMEDQQRADERAPHLARLPAPRRFISYEPAIEPVDFRPLLVDRWPLERRVDWVIIGGESATRPRPMHVEWAESAIGQCRAAEVDVFVKQLGTAPRIGRYRLRGEKDAARTDPARWPEHLRVQQRPAPLGLPPV